MHIIKGHNGFVHLFCKNNIKPSVLLIIKKSFNTESMGLFSKSINIKRNDDLKCREMNVKCRPSKGTLTQRTRKYCSVGK